MGGWFPVRPRTHRDRLAPEEQVPRGLLPLAPAERRGREYQRMKESAQVRYSGATISTMRPASSRPNKPNRHSTNGVGSGSDWLERAATSRIGVSSRMPMPIALAPEAPCEGVQPCEGVHMRRILEPPAAEPGRVTFP